MTLKSGRAGDVYCKRCGRPLPLNNAWKRRVGRGRDEFYCAEHVVITDGGLSWRPLGEGETPPALIMGEPEPAQREADVVPESTWVDEAPVLNVPASADDAYEVVPRPADLPAFPGGVHVRTPAAAAKPVVERLKELREQPVKPFNPFDDVGF